MGGRSSSSTSSTQYTTDAVFNNVDNRVAGGDGGIMGGNVNLNAVGSDIGGNVNVTTTDYGAIQGGLSAALAALESGNKGLDSSLEFVTDSNKLANQQTLQAIDRSFALAGEASKSEAANALQDFMKWSAIILLVGGAVYLVAKKLG
ncbi:hypothetical protein NVP1249A_16 [Vibrio phage 1.249.A._10N.261.55.B9]|uniref:Uncharacterized protein n=2 Tax=Autolykiviridae TaxID=2184034 RepID=A0A2I7RXF1_9VIRU|nr:hypothetical protein KMD63_gp16 [Vibrio phage 1.249.A._10N.261.55.B9]AUR98310.1 hypothetical protein NVP1249A_16 [Vibrio phage 1.249.A._10N.261.55.B9]AUR98332.1 hypothetical protein NVP1249B_16 [Vibrio phage 1.249.B._10N.261.55.B9]